MTSEISNFALSTNEPKNYQQKYLDYIKKIHEKNEKQKLIQEELRQKQIKIQESLKKKILTNSNNLQILKEQTPEKYLKNEANIKRQNSLQNENISKNEMRKLTKLPPLISKSQQKITPTPEEILEKQKMIKYFRSRYVSFINSLKQGKENKKNLEEAEKRKKENLLLKIREDMGILNIPSRLLEQTEITKIKKNEKIELKTTPLIENNEKDVKENQKRLLSKQKDYLINLFEKNAKKKLKKKLKEKNSENKLEIVKKKNLEKKNLKFSESSSDIFNPKNKNFQMRTEKEHETISNLENIKHLVTPIIIKKHQIKKLNSNITDLDEWKKKQKLSNDTKVFIILGGYNDLRQSLLKRGWVENPDSNSVCFDIKWTLFAKDIDYKNLKDFQIVNHYEKNTSITTKVIILFSLNTLLKVGLSKNLRNLIWFNNVDIDTFYPICFDLSDSNDFEDFIQEFKCIKAESILKIYLQMYQERNPQLKNFELKAKVALNVCEKRLQDIDEIIDEQNLEAMITDREWDILASDEMTVSELAKKKHENWLKKVDQKYNNSSKLKKNDKIKKPKKKKKKVKNIIREENEEESEKEKIQDELINKIKNCLDSLTEKFPQININGTNNIWILKPAGLSRGRGIITFNSLVEIIDHVESKESQWVIQKYIENPLLIKKKKFDIRQWVLVTDWNPLKIWVYEECYIRFSPEDYDANNLENKFIHLTNNSVVKYSSLFESSEIEGNMWTCNQFNDHLKEITGNNTFLEKIQPRIKEIIKWSLESVQDTVENRKNTHELYGYDFMVDEQFNPWLIEVNSSPAMDYSTPVTERLVKMVLNDLSKVIVDYGMAKKKKKDIDTGLFTCISKKNAVVEKPLNSCGINLVLEGKALKH